MGTFCVTFNLLKLLFANWKMALDIWHLTPDTWHLTAKTTWKGNSKVTSKDTSNVTSKVKSKIASEVTSKASGPEINWIFSSDLRRVWTGKLLWGSHDKEDGLAYALCFIWVSFINASSSSEGEGEGEQEGEGAGEKPTYGQYKR